MNVMIDLETLDNTATTVILSVGLVLFNEKTTIKSRYWVLDAQEQIRMGRTVSADTISWWLKQTKEAQEVVHQAASYKTSSPFHAGMLEIMQEIESGGEHVKVWGNGGDFDPVIMMNAFQMLGLNAPWRFWNTRCFRTFCESRGMKYKSSRTGGVSHNALTDAEDQVKHYFDIKSKRIVTDVPKFELPENLEAQVAERINKGLANE